MSPARQPAPLPVLDPLTYISGAVSRITGVQLGEKNVTMVRTRLARRIMELGLKSETEYFDYFRKHEKPELKILTSLFTTHHTFFFREFGQFKYLEKEGLKLAADAAIKRGDRTIRIWSAACSRGQECYSLAMFCLFHLPTLAPGVKFEIVGTDIDPECVDFAKNGVYRKEELQSAPIQYLSQHWARGTGEISDFAKAKHTLKEHIKFQTMNLLDFGSGSLGQKFDLIFCRNVFIYFKPDQIKSITQNFLKLLQPEGRFFIGISESINGLDLPIKSWGQSVYSHPLPASPASQKSGSPVNVAPIASVPAKLTRVFCIDDSPSVLKLLNKILSKENGFEVVGTAIHGQDATEKLKNLQVDVITLDIHMPVENGLEYLQKKMNSSHPPVVMISSVSREDAQLALKCLEAGAVDYVEKPGLDNLLERGDEICAKLSCAANRSKTKVETTSHLDRSFAQNLVPIDPETTVSTYLGGIGDIASITQVLRGQNFPTMPCIVLLEGCAGTLPALAKQFYGRTNINTLELDSAPTPLCANTIYLGDAKKGFDQATSLFNKRRPAFLVFASGSKWIRDKVKKFTQPKFVLEEERTIGSPTIEGSLVMPVSSFAYTITQELGKKGK